MSRAACIQESCSNSSISLSNSPSPGPRSRFGHALCALCMSSALALGACGGDDEPNDEPGSSSTGERDRGDFVTSWDPGGSDLAQVLEDEELFEDLADGLNSSLKLPRDLPIVHTSCGEENAFYDPNQGALLMCYELLDMIANISVDLANDQDELGERVIGTWLFVFFHELGHGLIDQYGLPITGREEDAVDDFSTLLMIQSDMAGYAAYAADFWRATDSGIADESQFADEHSLNAQRFYNILCLIYGSDPDQYEDVVTLGLLPEARAARCPGEYAQKSKSWDTLLEPWAKD